MRDNGAGICRFRFCNDGDNKVNGFESNCGEEQVREVGRFRLFVRIDNGIFTSSEERLEDDILEKKRS